MTNEFNSNEAIEAVEEAAPKKRTRKAPVKVQKTALDIINEVNALEAEVAQLHDAGDSLERDSVVFHLVNAEYEKKKDELEKAITTVYTI